MQPKQSYRPDIDGLRAVAVLAVLLDHLGTRLTGGYVGVDVFFVISGYLISSHILSEMQLGSFSLGTFYERRVRRIFPALLAMLLATSGFAFFCFLPSETVSFGRSLLAALFSVSNILFLHETGYFAFGSDLKPLLHTWSLAVEEQFYLVFPLLLMAVRRWLPNHLKAVIVTLACLSLAAAALWVQHDASATFFLAPFRGWELLLGTILSQNYLPRLRGLAIRNASALVGLALVLVPCFLYTANTLFPGLTALPPCIGAGLLLAAGRPEDANTGTTLVARLLSLAPVRFIGLISYSLYLWHWPVLVLCRNYLLLPDPILQSRFLKLYLLFLSVVLAVLSWRFVETPFRSGALRPSRARLFAITGTAAFAVVALGMTATLTGGLPKRFSPQVLAAARYLPTTDIPPNPEHTCFLQDTSPFATFDTSHCLPLTTPKGSILVFGDSHAAKLYDGLATVFPERHIEEAATAGCIPLLGELHPLAPYNRANCQKLADLLFNAYLPGAPVQTVVLVGKWSPQDLPGLARTVGWIQQHGMTPVVVGPNPEYSSYLPRLLAMASLHKNSSLVTQGELPGPALLDARLRQLAGTTWHVQYISFFADICGSNPCPLYAAPGVPLLYDKDHLTQQGSVLFAQAILNRNQLP